MSDMVTRYKIKFKKAAYAAYKILFAALSLLINFLLTESFVYAQELANEEIRIMFLVFKDMSDLFITFAYGAMILIFAVGIVKSGLTAQAAKQFGMPGRVSGELMNVLGGIVVFVLGILSFPLAKEVILRVTSSTGMNTAPTTGNLQIPGIK